MFEKVEKELKELLSGKIDWIKHPSDIVDAIVDVLNQNLKVKAELLTKEVEMGNILIPCRFIGKALDSDRFWINIWTNWWNWDEMAERIYIDAWDGMHYDETKDAYYIDNSQSIVESIIKWINELQDMCIIEER